VAESKATAKAKSRVAVVGGGITGLTVARQLVDRGHSVRVYERDDPGGLAGGVRFGDASAVYLDKFYHHIFRTDAAIIRLIAEHGLEADLLWRPSASGLVAAGRAWRFGTPLDLLRCRPIGSVWQRLRMGLNLQRFRRRSDWRDLDGISCRDYFARRHNLTGYTNLWEPLLRAKAYDDYETVPAAFLWGRVHARAGSRERGRERLGYLRGGFQRLIDAMVEAIRARGGEVHAHDAVVRVVPGERPEVESQHERERFDRVVWTAGLDLLLETIEAPSRDVADKGEAIGYVAATCLVLVLQRPLGDFYWLNSLERALSFGAVIEHTNLVGTADYGGASIVYVACYHAQEHKLASMSAGELLHLHWPSLERIFPDLTCHDIKRTLLFRASHASPLYTLRYAERMPPYTGWLPGVDICGVAQVYPFDRNMSHCVANARRYVASVYGP